MVHYKAHNGYEMHRVFNLPPIEFRINQPLKKVIEFLFFKKIYERKQVPSSLVPYDKKYFWPLLYFKGFYQSERFFADMADDKHLIAQSAGHFNKSHISVFEENVF